MSLDWSSLVAQPQSPLALEQAQAAARENVQQTRALNALSGVDLNNPDTVNSALQGSLRAGALDQANALLRVNLMRQIYSQAPNALQTIANAANGQQEEDQQPQQQPTQDQQAYQAAHSTMNSAAALIKDMQALPDSASRQALFEARVKDPDFQNIDPGAIDSVRDHLGDSNFATESLDQLLNHYQGHAANFGALAAGHPAQSVAMHPTNNWGLNLLQNPGALQAMSLLKMAGLDLTPMLEGARTVAAPIIQAQADIAKAGPVAEALVGPHVQQTLYDELIKAGIEPQIAGKVAAAQAAATAPYHAVPGITDPRTGAPIYTSEAEFAAAHGGPPLAEGKAPPALPAEGAGPGVVTAKTAQAGQASDLLKPDPVARNQAVDTEANAERALQAVQNLRLDNLAPIKVQVARAMRTAGIGGDFVNRYAVDSAGLEANATNALVSGAHQAFPSRTTDTDLKTMRSVYGGLTSPNDQMAFSFGMQAAAAHRTQQLEDYKANYSGDKTDPSAVQRGWLAGPGGQSIYASPVWGRVMIGGRAAFNPQTDTITKGGHTWGIFAPGLGPHRAVPFLIK